MFNTEQKLQLIEYLDSADDFKKNGDYLSAIDCYEKVIRIDPEIASVYSVLANLYSKAYGNKSHEKQILCYKQLLKLKPESSLALHGLAFCYEKLGNNDEAEKYYLKLLENEPTSIDYYNYGCSRT